MNLFTIGFTKKSAERFFALLSESGAKRIVDVRLRPGTQLSGFAKKNDLEYFLRSICNIDYVHLPELAPDKDMLDEYRKSKAKDAWDRYEEQFLKLIEQRQIEHTIPKDVLEDACLLCSEDLHEHCHRRLVAEYLNRCWGNVKVTHLR